MNNKAKSWANVLIVFVILLGALRLLNCPLPHQEVEWVFKGAIITSLLIQILINFRFQKYYPALGVNYFGQIFWLVTGFLVLTALAVPYTFDLNFLLKHFLPVLIYLTFLLASDFFVLRVRNNDKDPLVSEAKNEVKKIWLLDITLVFSLLIAFLWSLVKYFDWWGVGELSIIPNEVVRDDIISILSILGSHYFFAGAVFIHMIGSIFYLTSDKLHAIIER